MISYLIANLLLVTIYLWVFWGFYVLVMGLYRAHLQNKLTRFTYFLSAPFLLIGVLMDVLANMTIASVLFAELPHEWMVTTRLTRYNNFEYGWRSRIAEFVCTNLLDVFDPNGNHC